MTRRRLGQSPRHGAHAVLPLLSWVAAVIGRARPAERGVRMSDRVPTTNFSTSWTHVDQTSDPSFYANLLAATRAQVLDQFRSDPDNSFGALGLRPGLRLLDVGCGTGDYLRVMAPLVAPGEAIGIDLSAELVRRAGLLSLADQPNLSFQVADVYDLPFANASFDRVTAAQVMLHLADPWNALTELRRVLVPGGRVSIAEWDWDSTCLAVTDRDLGRRFIHLLCDQMHNGLIVRELAWRLAGHGFIDVDVVPQVRISRDLGAAYEWLIRPATEEFVRIGALSQTEGARFLDDLRERAASGRYFLARTFYVTVATAG
jgi:ubiquinone/menaquinone biosynthesis C-methylase UbiE